MSILGEKNCTLAESVFLIDGKGSLGLLAQMQLYPLHTSHVRGRILQNDLYQDLHTVIFLDLLGLGIFLWHMGEGRVSLCTEITKSLINMEKQYFLLIFSKCT